MVKRTVKKSVQVLRFLRSLYDENSLMSEARAGHVSRIVAETYHEHLSPRDVINHFADRRYRLKVKRTKTPVRSDSCTRPDRTTNAAAPRRPAARHAAAPASCSVDTVPFAAGGNASRATDVDQLASRPGAPRASGVERRPHKKNNDDPDAVKRAERSKRHTTTPSDFACDLPRCTGYFLL